MSELVSPSSKTAKLEVAEQASRDESGDAGAGGAGAGGGGAALTAAQRARMERQRQRARALHAARLAPAPAPAAEPPHPSAQLDTGGGFLLEPAGAAGGGGGGGGAGAGPPPVRAAPAPLVHRSQQPACAECGKPFPQSYLFDTFDCSVCDACRDDEGAHALLTRTEAKAEFLLKDCDLDARPPPLRCVRRRNPHRGGGDMRLYLRAQVEARALLVWGSPAALEAERERRGERRGRARRAAADRRLRALRLQVRSSLLAPAAGRAPHAHRWAAETHCAADDTYSRTCLDCGHVETYEKM